jgi:hypothetical protein
MKPSPANLSIAEIFAPWPAHFCRVACVATGNFRLKLKNLPFFKEFLGHAGFFSPWHARC